MRKPFHARKFKIEIVIFSRLIYQEFPDGDKGLQNWNRIGANSEVFPLSENL